MLQVRFFYGASLMPLFGVRRFAAAFFGFSFVVREKRKNQSGGKAPHSKKAKERKRRQSAALQNGAIWKNQSGGKAPHSKKAKERKRRQSAALQNGAIWQFSR